MLLQNVAFTNRVQHEVLSAHVAHKGHGERRSFRLGESKIVSNLGIARRLVADIAALSDAIGKVAFLEQKDQFLGYVLKILIPVCSKKGRISTAVESAKVVVYPGLGIVEWSLTSGYFIVT